MPGIGGHEVLDKGFVTEAAQTQYRFVKPGTAARSVVPADTLGELVLGVVQEDATAQDATDGRHVNVRMLGVSVVEASAAIAAGAEVTTAADGRAVTVAATQRVVGVALDAASGAGDWIGVLLVPAGRVA